MTITAFELGRILYEARTREAYQKNADMMLKRNPWPKHIAAHDIAAAHELCIAEAKALLVRFDLIEKANP